MAEAAWWWWWWWWCRHGAGLGVLMCGECIKYASSEAAPESGGVVVDANRFYGSGPSSRYRNPSQTWATGMQSTNGGFCITTIELECGMCCLATFNSCRYLHVHICSTPLCASF
ncbi:hypothetical protein DFP73DRAFT_566854 [Morchella snyderi]|nr:hypothetical protein DFP73DRAFT_566854 [Morchella snyderi]